MRNRIFSSAIVIAGGLFATTALANTGESGMHKDQKHQNVSFEKVDQNGDGYISQSEFQNSGAFQVDHKKLDTDNDGRVNQSEFAAFEPGSQQGQQQGQQQDRQQQQQQYEYDQGTDFEDESDFTTDPAQDPTQTQDDY